MSRILRYLVCLFMLIFAGNALAAGYSCPSYKKYTSCAEGYYISYCGTGDNADWWEYFNKNGGVPTTDLAPGNSCVACPTSSVSSPGVKYVCAGGLMCPENVGILVSCDLNGGSLPPGMALANLTCTKGEPCTLIRGTGIHRAGYVMVGWSLDKNATEGDFTITLDGVDSATVYAVWQPCARGTYKPGEAGGETACYACSGGQYSDTEGASECKWARGGYYTVCDQGGPGGEYCTGVELCTGANYCSNGHIEPCPEPESGWIAGTGEGWRSFRDCFEYRNATDISEYCATGSLKKWRFSQSDWGSDVRVGEKFMAAPGGYVTGSGEDLNCAACEAGYVCAGGELGPEACDAATEYQDETGQWACKAVDDGYYKSSNAAQAWCPAGYRDGAGAASQSNCEAQCTGGHYVPSVHAACAPVGVGYWRGAHSVKYGATDTRTKCATGLTTIGSGAGADEAGDCGRVLNIGSQKIYLRSDKKTDRALRVGINGDVFYGNMSTSIDGPLKINYNGTTYSVYDDSME